MEFRSRSAAATGLAEPAARRTTQTSSTRIVVAGVCALAAAMGIGRFAYTPILPAMQDATGLSTSDAGLLASANYAGYLAGALALAAFPLHHWRRPLLIGSLIATAALTAAMALTTSLPVWSAIRFLSGVASAGVFILASGAVLQALAQRGEAARSGWLYSGVGLGIATSGIVVQLATDSLGWPGDWLALSALAAGLIIPCVIWLPGAASPANPSPLESVRPRRSADRGRALLYAAYFLEAVGYIIAGTFLVAIVDATPGLEGTGPGVWVVVGLAGIPAAMVWSAIGARLGVRRALVLAYVVQSFGLLLPIAGGLSAAILAAVLFGGTFIGVTALTMTLAGRLAPERPTELIGLLTAIYGVGQIIGPLLAGGLERRAASFTPALIVAASLVLLGGALMAVDGARHRER